MVAGNPGQRNSGYRPAALQTPAVQGVAAVGVANQEWHIDVAARMQKEDAIAHAISTVPVL
jgi:hypothetical protein